jgi:hypothetical protein
MRQENEAEFGWKCGSMKSGNSLSSDLEDGLSETGSKTMEWSDSRVEALREAS